MLQDNQTKDKYDRNKIEQGNQLMADLISNQQVHALTIR